MKRPWPTPRLLALALPPLGIFAIGVVFRSGYRDAPNFFSHAWTLERVTELTWLWFSLPPAAAIAGIAIMRGQGRWKPLAIAVFLAVLLLALLIGSRFVGDMEPFRPRLR